VAWGLLGLGCVGSAAAVALSVANGTLLRNQGEALLLVVFAAFLVVGCLILARRPGNVIGWIFTAVGLLTMTAVLAETYAEYAYVTRPGSLPAPLVGVWVVTWIWTPTIMLMLVFPLLLFPTGRSLSPRWLPVTWLAVGLIAAYIVLGALYPTLDLPDGRTVANPIGVAWINVDASPVGAILIGLTLSVLVAAIVSLVLRFRRSRGVERQQMKWFAYAIVVLIGGSVLTGGIADVTGVGWMEGSSFLLSMIGLMCLPIAVGVAILRYRLYEIDLIINRTLVYGPLTATLALVYFGGVAATQLVFRALTDQQQQPQLAVVASTLVIAALFNPLRRRIQSFIDHRFYRQKYDARKTLEAFSARLRNETNLQALSGELTRVVGETMQPAHVSLWLSPDTSVKGSSAGASLQ
jgi:hypothetical protein